MTSERADRMGDRRFEGPMPTAEPRMTPAQMAALVDAAFRTPHPVAFLDTAVLTFRTLGRHADGTASAWMGWLCFAGEIEILMSLRAAWRRGEVRSPAEAVGGAGTCRSRRSQG